MNLSLMTVSMCVLISYYHQQLKKRKKQISVTRNQRWSPWNDPKICDSNFFEMFRMSRADFFWLVECLEPSLALDPLWRGDPFSVELQVAIGLYRCGQAASFGQLSHLFNIGTKSANTTFKRFVHAVIDELHDLTIGYAFHISFCFLHFPLLFHISFFFDFLIFLLLMVF